MLVISVFHLNNTVEEYFLPTSTPKYCLSEVWIYYNLFINIRYFNYIMFSLAPRCLSPLIYGFCSQKHRLRIFLNNVDKQWIRMRERLTTVEGLSRVDGTAGSVLSEPESEFWRLEVSEEDDGSWSPGRSGQRSGEHWRFAMTGESRWLQRYETEDLLRQMHGFDPIRVQNQKYRADAKTGTLVKGVTPFSVIIRLCDPRALFCRLLLKKRCVPRKKFRSTTRFLWVKLSEITCQHPEVWM